MFEHMQTVNKYAIILTKLFTLFLFGWIISFSHPVMGISPESYKLKKVVIDAGHGGKDSGALGRKSMEKDIVLTVALQVGQYINEHFPEVEVLYTRDKDVFIGLDERSSMANESGADLFISIHCNSNPSSTPFGTETYVMGLHKSEGNLDVAMRENAVITYEDDYSSKYEGYDPSSAESFIIFSLMQNHNLDQSLNMASLIQGEFKDRARRHDRGVKQAGFIVLWKTSMPSVLVELGFLSNSKEEEYLLSESGQTYLASAIFRAFRSYKDQIETKSSYAAEHSFDYSKANQTTDNAAHQRVNFGSGVTYKVQLAASNKQIPANDPFFKNLDGVEEYTVKNQYKYLVGNQKTYQEIARFCEEVRELFPDAFIIAFENGEQITLEQAKKLMQK